MKYAIVIEKSETGYGAYVLDLPGCAVVAETEREVRKLIREAIAIHVQELRAQGDEIPEPSSVVDYIEIPSAA
ncbi:MAG: type II toxin-antitoxin system HicB family antitoxin [Longimicrobiales bacterium]